MCNPAWEFTDLQLHCKLKSGSKKTVCSFKQVEQAGTFWYHSHVRGQYPDGLRGPMVIHDPEDPHKDLYDEEILLTFSDWYHGMMNDLLAHFISVANPSGAEPVPNSALVNETQDLAVKLEPGKTYKVRMVNIGAFAAQYVWFENHTMRIIEVDGVNTEPADADMIYMTPAQRYSVLITAKNSSTSNFAFVGSMDQVSVSHPCTCFPLRLQASHHRSLAGLAH